MLSNKKLLQELFFITAILASFSTIMTGCKPIGSTLKSSDYVNLAKEKTNNFKTGYKFEEVLSDYAKAIEIDANNIDAYNGRGKLYSKSCEYIDYHNESNLHMLYEYQDLAIDDFNKAIKINPNAESYISRAFLKKDWREKNWTNSDYSTCNRAEEDINKAIKLDPNSSEAYHLRGRCKGVNGDSKGELEDYNKSIELDPNNIETYYSRAFLKRVDDKDNSPDRFRVRSSPKSAVI